MNDNIAVPNNLPVGFFEFGLGYNAFAPASGGFSNDNPTIVNDGGVADGEQPGALHDLVG